MPQMLGFSCLVNPAPKYEGRLEWVSLSLWAAAAAAAANPPKDKRRGNGTVKPNGGGRRKTPSPTPHPPPEKKDRQCHAKTRQKKKTEWKSSPHMLSTGEHRGVTREKRGKGTTKLLTGEKFD